MAVPEILGARWYRDQLCPHSQDIYDRIHSQIARKDYSGRSVFPFPSGTPNEVAFAALRALRKDHPEYYFLSKDREITRHPQTQTATLRYNFYYSPEILARIEPQLQRALRRYTHGTERMSVLEKEATIYERITTTLKYIDTDDESNYNIVGPLLFGGGVCAGITDWLILCLRRSGIPSIRVRGKAGERAGLHAWCVAYIFGEPMHLDPTWDLNEKGCQFKYFNLSDRQIAAFNHFDFKSPRCVAEAYSQFDPHRDRIRFKYAI